jgi:hypothetical protein
MKTTPRLAIPYAEPGDDLNDYPVDVDLPAANRLEALLWPTSWTTLPATGPGTILYTTSGGLLVVQVDMTGGSWQAGTIYTVSASPLPVGLRPAKTIRGYADFGGYQGGGYAGSDGNIGIRHQSGGTRTNLNMTLVGLIA